MKTSDVIPIDNLIEATKQTKSRGSCTFTSLHLEQEKAQIRGLNLGDSGFIILRDWESIKKKSTKIVF